MESWRARLGILILIVFSFYQTLQALEYYRPGYVLRHIQRGEIPANFLAIYRKQSACLLPLLPPDQVIGFITTVPDKRQMRDEIYHMTQFVIVPTIMDDSTDHQLVIGYFPKKIKIAPTIPAGFSIETQCTDEIFLLKRNGP